MGRVNFSAAANTNKPHPEEAALFCAAVSKDGYAHRLVPSFETHRLSDAPQDEADGWICRRDTPRRSAAQPHLGGGKQRAIGIAGGIAPVRWARRNALRRGRGPEARRA